MNFIIWIIVGSVLGWLGNLVMGANNQQDMILNIIVGILGAFLAGLILTPLLGASTINQSNFSIAGLFISFAGAVILLGVINLITPRRAR